MTLDDQIKDTQHKLNSLIAKKKSSMSMKTIKCASCNKSARIRDITLIDVQGYESPHGCTGGDYWYHSEYNYVCSNCNTRNRLLFSTQKIKYEHRKYHSPERYFFNQYQPLFKSTITDDSRTRHSFVNNYFVDKNLMRFIGNDSMKQLEKYYG